MRRIFVDAEFKNLPWTGHGDLLWLGLADDAGNSWAGINGEVDLGNASRFTLDVVVPLMRPDQPRLTRMELAAAVIEFCAQPDEFWAWCPTVDDLGAAFGLSRQEAVENHGQFWDWDFQLLRQLVQPWPKAWPSFVNDLHALAVNAGIELPPNNRAHNPRHDALWDREVWGLATAGQLIDATGPDSVTNSWSATRSVEQEPELP